MEQDCGSFLSWWQLYYAGKDNVYDHGPKREPESLLYLAAEMGQHQVIRELLEGGADINAERYIGTPLRVAADEGHIETVRVLLEEGRGLLEKGKKKYKPMGEPMSIAAGHGFAECVQLLLDYGTEESSDWIRDCRNAISTLPLGFPDERENIMEIFLATKPFQQLPTAEEANFSISDMPNFLGVFMCSLGCGWEKSSRLMFGLGSDVIISANDGGFLDICLHYIIMRGHVKLLKMIMENDKARAISTRLDKHRAHLQKAAYYGREKIVEFLLTFQKAFGIEGLGISLHIAVAGGHINIMERLLHAGADPLQKDDDGWSPLVYASQYLQDATMEKLSVFMPISHDLRLEVEAVGKDKLVCCDLLIWLADIETAEGYRRPIVPPSANYSFEVEIIERYILCSSSLSMSIPLIIYK